MLRRHFKHIQESKLHFDLSQFRTHLEDIIEGKFEYLDTRCKKGINPFYTLKHQAGNQALAFIAVLQHENSSTPHPTPGKKIEQNTSTPNLCDKRKCKEIRKHIITPHSIQQMEDKVMKILTFATA